ncbi:NUDIX hydrolase [Knoellia aerolata]|uniref:NUDIX hydrolase n=1 Tax=Knoellia aerolata TaxID=442954 RepID=UPI000691EDC6|nr:NUDIX domain-containing protein [Knoellia aerolata]
MTRDVSTRSADPAVSAAFAHLHAQARATLGSWHAPDERQDALRAAYLEHLHRHPDGVAKAGPPEHLTASCLVLSPDAEHVLLTHHRRARSWFQFGGHLDVGDVDLHAAATREAREESGIPTVTPAPVVVQLDRHILHGDFVHCREHLDVRFAAVLDRTSTPTTGEESLEVAWWPTSRLPQGTRAELGALVDAARLALDL